MVKRRFWYIPGLLLIFLLAACGSSQSNQITSVPITSDSIQVEQHPAPTAQISVPRQVLQPTPTPKPKPTPAPQQSTSPVAPAPPPPTTIGPGIGPAPYGPPPPITAEEMQLTQQLFALINQDRAVRGLYPFVWNDTLAGGARLHSWNMFHCGFSHTCPDGEDQCTRIANEGFAGYTDCGECIGLAGPANPLWPNIYGVQEGMINEPPTGWHHIHLTSTTLHRIGVGIYVDPNGQAWFTEDMVS